MKKKYLYPEIEEIEIALSGMIALSTPDPNNPGEDEDERAPQTIKERNSVFKEDLWEESSNNSLW